jgi:NADH-quinone oxidoreductase subunit K
MTIPIDWYIALSAVLFSIGAAGVLLRRNPIVVLLSVEIMLNAGNLALIAFSRAHGIHDGQVLAVIVMAIAASEVVVGLGIVVALSHLRRELDIDELAEMHG